VPLHCAQRPLFFAQARLALLAVAAQTFASNHTPATVASVHALRNTSELRGTSIESIHHFSPLSFSSSKDAKPKGASGFVYLFRQAKKRQNIQ
jgi:hypothetical protein